MIGRIEEKKYLKSLLNEEESQFVAVIGRRRIGKTYLIRESFDYNFTFEHTGISNNSVEPGLRKQTQLEKFQKSLEEKGYKCVSKITSWSQAFDALGELIKSSNDKKKVIFIDELSWMDTKDSGLISALESFWNGFVTARKEKDVVLIVCASATYWMIDNILNAKGGLHNRLTGQIHLKGFTLKECEEYLQSKNIVYTRQQILELYMIFGGVPYYFSLLKKGKSLNQNIDEIIFNENAPLSNEFNNLYNALFDKPDLYIRIIESLSKSNKGLTRKEICTNLNIESSGNISKKLLELENCGFIRKYVPYGYESNNLIYQLIDNFTIFYYKFLVNKTNDENYWEHTLNAPSKNAWNGFSFERVCLEHIKQIKMALGILGVQTEVNLWKCSADLENGIFGSQIDLLIVRKDQIINLCEIKYSISEYLIDKAFDTNERRKISDFKLKTKTKYAIYPTLITTYGVIENAYSNNFQSIITLDDLFN